MNRTDIINHLIKENNFTSYLEIGVQTGVNFNKIKCKRKVSVDPDVNSVADFKQTSDTFFRENKETFDIVFIDGLHQWQQVIKDIDNAFLCTPENGIIVVHDCNPMSEISQVVPRKTKDWHGDVWKAWIEFRSYGYESYVVDTDCGCGVIRKKEVTPFKPDAQLTYQNLERNRKRWLNLISVESFLTREQVKLKPV